MVHSFGEPVNYCFFSKSQVMSDFFLHRPYDQMKHCGLNPMDAAVEQNNQITCAPGGVLDRAPLGEH